MGASGDRGEGRRRKLVKLGFARDEISKLF